MKMAEKNRQKNRLGMDVQIYENNMGRAILTGLGILIKEERMMSWEKLLCAYMVAALGWSTAGETTAVSQLIGYDDSSPSNLVVAVAGYQTVRRHESGIDVPVFSIDEGAGAGEETGILFYIVAPTNYAGRFFFVTCPRGLGPFEDQQAPSEKMFPKNKLFYFRLDDGKIQEMLESKYCMDTRDSFSTWHMPGTQYYWAVEDCEAYLTKSREMEERYKRELPALKEKFKKERQVAAIEGGGWRYPLPDAARDMFDAISLRNHALVALPHRIKEAEEQLERLKKIRRIKKPDEEENQ